MNLKQTGERRDNFKVTAKTIWQFPPPISTGCKNVPFDNFTYRLRVVQSDLSTSSSFARFQLHPNLNQKAKTRNGVQHFRKVLSRGKSIDLCADEKEIVEFSGELCIII
jgi:hypothetical protein